MTLLQMLSILFAVTHLPRNSLESGSSRHYSARSAYRHSAYICITDGHMNINDKSVIQR